MNYTIYKCLGGEVTEQECFLGQCLFVEWKKNIHFCEDKKKVKSEKQQNDYQHKLNVFILKLEHVDNFHYSYLSN